LSIVGLDWVRSRQRALARAVLALFCLVWVQAALLPCAMAIVPDGLGSMGAEHCVYCPEGQAPELATDTGVTPACLYPDDAQADQRPFVAGFATPLLAASLFTLPPVAPDPPESRRVAAPDDRPRPDYAVAYCRFLK
jgi:hypothetical protein